MEKRRDYVTEEERKAQRGPFLAPGEDFGLVQMALFQVRAAGLECVYQRYGRIVFVAPLSSYFAAVIIQAQ